MKVSWTKGLDKQLAIDVKQNFKESLVMRKRLVSLLHDKAALSNKLSMSKEGYDKPNWAYLQADARGYERALFEIISLISSEEEL